jgi:hypothetical protein
MSLPSLGLSKAEFKRVATQLEEAEMSVADFENKYRVTMWHYPAYIKDASGIEMVVEGVDDGSLVKFAIDFASCLDDGGMIALLAGGKTS